MTHPVPPPESVEALPATGSPEAALRRAGLTPSPWSAGAGAVFAPHRHHATKRLFVVEGSIQFTGDFGTLDLAAGQGMRLAAGTDHAAVAGPSGVRCVEAFEAAG